VAGSAGGGRAGAGTVVGVRRLQVIGSGLAVLAVLAVAWLLLRNADGLPEVRASVAAAGFWAPLLFVLLQVAVTVLPFPRTLFTVAAGVLFGSVAGLLLTVTATVLAASAAFWLVRLVGARFASRHADRPGVAWIRSRLDRSGLLAMVSLRLIPMVPFPVLNYASALSGVRFAPFAVGTALGVLPGTVAVVVLGDAAVGGNPHPAMLAVSVVCGVLGVAGAVHAARRGPAPAEPTADDPAS
jgi:uncharacterized membrane protein YdjX (TVP38/TMEM64 family)